MGTDPSQPPVIDSHAAFVAAIAWGFEHAIARGARRIVCCDADFLRWPLDDEATLDRLAAWLRLPQRRLMMVARQYTELPRRWPRFTAWRRDYSYAITTAQLPADWEIELPSVLACDSGISVHLIDAVHWRGRADCDSRSARLWCERIDVVLQRSEAAFGVQTLGL